MTPDWSALDRELAQWQVAGLRLPLWWRDDDAGALTPQLAQLQALSAKLDLPVHLAIIPARLKRSLKPVLAEDPLLVPLVHGWAHRSHEPQGEKLAEFGPHRKLKAALRDARRGLAKLRPLLKGSPPMFVPPWNRIAPEITAGLAGLGFEALSTFTPRAQYWAAPGLVQINTHIDPINWRGDRSLVPPDDLLAQVVRHLSDRRQGQADADEPYGVLTHHLVHDAAIWQFTDSLLQRLLDGPAIPWRLQRSEQEGPAP